MNIYIYINHQQHIWERHLFGWRRTVRNPEPDSKACYHPTRNDMCSRLSIHMIKWSSLQKKTKQSKNAIHQQLPTKIIFNLGISWFIIAPGPEGSSRHFLSRFHEAGGFGPSFCFRIWFRQGRPSTLRLEIEVSLRNKPKYIIGASEPTNDGWK